MDIELLQIVLIFMFGLGCVFLSFLFKNLDD